ncbi:metallophosphoesterase family protein [Sphingomonas sp. DG1-23]|uniref:metallophosphoesterase family protein n=1 Tax=Sphingomonas sp. DG1-23 TaxID=3068316 RepID=UPI00273DE4D5|nr:metallophosphoesterase family protein [Sphingomonas sp. DG1-23]MDP5280667.1 metallophosphoesterase family protein [Sphingomonas sp. DG1-23]
MVPPGERIYAIGDIHGRLDLIEALLGRIVADDRARPEAQTQLIFLGDLIDRGPQSAQVIEFALGLESSAWNCRFLLGNHEEVFLKALTGDLKALAFFIRIGGRETILSYGVSEAEYAESDYPELLELLVARVPASHVEFLNRFEDLIVAGDYAFVHAGVRPGQQLADQRTRDLRWIRSEFLDHPEDHGKIIVHGHTVTDDAQFRHNRIGIDTGAYASGKLTALALEGAERWVLDTAGQK